MLQSATRVDCVAVAPPSGQIWSLMPLPSGAYENHQFSTPSASIPRFWFFKGQNEGCEGGFSSGQERDVMSKEAI
jgi:hypothetical protein